VASAEGTEAAAWEEAVSEARCQALVVAGQEVRARAAWEQEGWESEALRLAPVGPGREGEGRAALEPAAWAWAVAVRPV